MAEDTQNLGLGVIFSATISEFTSQITAIENKLKEFASRLEALQGTADKTGKTLVAANKDAEKAMSQVTAATKEASAASADAAKVVEKLSTNMAKNKENIAGVGSAVAKAAVSYKDLSFETMNLLGSTKGIAENILPSLVERLRAASGESEGYRAAMIRLAADAKGSNVKFDEFCNTLKKVERNILQTESAFGKVRSQLGIGALPKDLSNWASSVDRVRAVQATLNGELYKSQGVVVNTSGNFLELQRTLAAMKKEYGEAAWAATDMDGRLGSYVKTVAAAKTELSNYVKSQIPFNRYMAEAEKAIQATAAQMTLMGKAGTSWAEGVDKGRVATAFMNGEIVNANGVLLQYGKTTAQVRAEVEKAGAGFRKELGSATFNEIRNQLGVTIPTIEKYKAALNATAKEMGRTHDQQQLYNRAMAELRNVAGLSASAQNLFATSVASGYRSLDSAIASAEKLVKRQTELKMSSQTLAENQAFLSLRYRELLNSQTSYGENARFLLANMDASRQGYRMINEQLIQLTRSMKEAEQAAASWNKIQSTAKGLTMESSAYMASLNGEIKRGTLTHAEAITKWKEHTAALTAAGSAAKSSGTFWDGLHAKLMGTASAAGSATNFMARLGSAVGSLAAWIPAALIIGTVTKAVTGCAEAVLVYDQSLRTLEAISGGTRAEISMLGKEILKISDNTKYSADEIAKGAVYIAQAGFTASESLKVIGAAAQGAQGTLETLSVASDLLTTVIRAFNIDASKAASVMDMLAVAANQSKTNLEGLKTMFNYLGPTAHSAGLSLSETLGAVMALSNVGIKASTIGTSFRQVLIQLENPSKKFRDAIRESGLQLEDFNVKSNGLIKVLQNMNTVIGGDFAKAAAFFNVRAGNTALVLSQMHEHVKMMVDATQEYGAAAIMAGTQTEGLSMKFEILGNRFRNMIIRLSEGGFSDLLGRIVSLVTDVISAMNYLLDNPLAKMAVSFVLVATAVGVFNQALLFLTTKIGVVSFFTTFIGALEAYVAANYAAITASTGLGTVLLYLNGVFKALYVTIISHPWIALAAAIGAVVIGVYEYAHAGEKASIAAQEQTIKYNDLAVSANNYANELLALSERQKNGSVITSDYHAVLLKVKETMPELSKQMLAVNNNLEAQAEVLKKAALGYEALKNTKAEEAIKRITEQEDAAILSGTNWIQKLRYVGEALDEETRKVLLNSMSYEENLRVRSQLNQYAKEKAAQILMMNEANQIRELEKLANDEYGKMIRQIVEGGALLKKSLEEQGRTVTDETISSLSRLGEEWQNYYKQQDEAGKAHLNKVMEQAINAGKRAAEQAKKNGQLEDEAVTAAQNEILNKEIERRQKQGETVLKTIDQITKDRISALKAGYMAEQEVAENEEKLALVRLRNEVSIEEEYLQRKQKIEERFAQESLTRTQNNMNKSIEIIRKSAEAQTEIINKSGQFVDKQAEINRVLKRAAEEEIAVYQTALAKYKSIIDEKVSEANRYKNEYLAALKAISDAEKNYTKISEDLEDMKRDALRSTMTETEKGRDTLLQFEEYNRKAMEALVKSQTETSAAARKEQLDIMKQYLDKSKGMINEITEYTISSDGKTKIDAENTARIKIRLIDEMKERYKALYDAVAQYAKEEAKAAEEAGKSAEETIKTMTEAMRKIQDEMSKAVVLKFDTSQATETLQKALKTLDETFDKKKYEVEIAFLGVASPPAPLLETIANIQSKMAELDAIVREYKIVLTFLASVGGETAAMSFSEGLATMQNQLATFAGQLAAIAPNVTVQFYGYGASSNNEWLSTAFTLAKNSAEWLSQQINALVTKFNVTFLGDGQPLFSYINAVEAAFVNLKSRIESLSTTYTITTRYVTTGTASTSYVGGEEGGGEGGEGGGEGGGGGGGEMAEGGMVPGVGNSDSVPAMLMPGEYVVRKSVVGALGEGFFNMINNMKNFSIPRIVPQSVMPAYASGGLVKDHQIFTLNLAVGSVKVPLKVVGSPKDMRTQIKQLEKELSRMRLGYV